MVTFLFCLLAVLGLYLVGVGVTLSRRRRHTCFAYVSIPTTTRYGRGEHCSPAKKHKETFPLSYFCVTKRRVQGGEATSERRRRDGVYQKSFKRIFHPLKNLLPRARVIRKNCAWRACATNGRAKIGGFTAPRNLILPRVRTYHTREPSRFVHALPARPL